MNPRSDVAKRPPSTTVSPPPAGAWATGADLATGAGCAACVVLSPRGKRKRPARATAVALTPGTRLARDQFSAGLGGCVSTTRRERRSLAFEIQSRVCCALVEDHSRPAESRRNAKGGPSVGGNVELVQDLG